MRKALIVLSCLFAALSGCRALAQTTYPPVVPPARLVFPQDFGAHPQFRVEWWYLTGWLDQADGQGQLGFQLTLFRLRPGLHEGNPSTFAPRQLLFAHAALSDPAQGRLRSAEKSARAGFGLAEAEIGDTRVAIDDWFLRRESGSAAYVARARGADFSYELTATPAGPPLLQGDSGLSRKAADPRHASYYYSRPHLATHGWVEVDGRRREVRGGAWLDHEWSSESMPDGAVGWDWVGINLADGGALMAFRMRDRAGGTLWAGGTLQVPGAPTKTFAPHEVVFTPLRRWRSPRTAGDYPVELALRIGTMAFHIVPLFDDQELDSRRSVGAVYWEGAIRVVDRQMQELGRGYLELTGYVAPLQIK